MTVGTFCNDHVNMLGNNDCGLSTCPKKKIPTSNTMRCSNVRCKCDVSVNVLKPWLEIVAIQEHIRSFLHEIPTIHTEIEISTIQEAMIEEFFQNICLIIQNLSTLTQET